MNGLLSEETLDHEHEVEIAKAMRVQWMFWIFATSPPIVFVVLCHVLGGRFSRRVIEPSTLEIFRTTFMIMGGIDLILSFVLRRYLFSPLFKGYSAPAQRQDSSRSEPLYIMQYRIKTIITTTLASSIGVLGFVLYIQGDNMGVFYIFVVFSLIGCLYHRPKRHEILKLYNESLQHRQPGLSGEEGST